MRAFDIVIRATWRIPIVIREDQFELLSKFCFNLSVSLTVLRFDRD